VASERRKAMELIQRCLSFLKNRKLSAGWNSWLASAAEQRKAVAVLTSARRGLLHLMHGKLTAGWNSWVAMAAERRKALGLLQSCLSFLKNRKLAPAFMSWLAALESEESARIARAVRHLMHRELSLGWVSWHAQWQEVVRKRSSASRGLLHLIHGKLSAGWLSWAAMAAEQRDAIDRQASTRSVLLHLANRKLSFGWNSWVAMAAARRRPLELVRRGLGFLVNRKLALAFMSWMGTIEEEASNRP